MPLQNRVDPWGVLHAVASRGTLMGNRGGKFHRADQTLGKRHWASQHWIACDLHYKNWHHEPMGEGYTSLFFLDEVTALAAGHRPCFMCRNAEAKAFLGGEKVAAFDRRVHQERLKSLTLSRFAEGEASKGAPGADASRPRWCEAPQHEGELVDGVMIELDGEAYAVRHGRLLHWTFDGYDRSAALQRPSRILTPPSIVAILARGYKPRWHLSIKTHEAS